MRYAAFASRNRKEIIRDPFTLLFGVGLPVVLLLLFSMMHKSIGVDIFRIENLTPGIVVFSLSFITLFSGMLIGRDRSSSYLMRIFASPLKAADYIIGYTVPQIPIAILQMLVCLVTAFILGMSFTIHILMALAILVINSLLFVGMGILAGTFLSDKQVGGFFALFVNIASWLGGIWFELDLIGGAFKKIAYLLPFAHAVDATRFAFLGRYSEMAIPLLWVIGYTVVIFFVAVVVFNRKMKS